MRNRAIEAGLLTLGILTSINSAEAQTAAIREGSGFSVDLAIANVGINEFDTNRLGVGLIPRWCPRNPRLCWWIDIWWIPDPWPDPWRGTLLTRQGPVFVGDLEVGPGLMFAPALEYTFRTEDRLRPSLYAGFGLQRDEGQTTTIPGVGEFSTSSVTSPVAIYGLGLTYDLSSRTALRFTAGGATAFTDEMVIRGPGGQEFPMEGEDMTSGIVSVGLNFALGNRR